MIEKHFNTYYLKYKKDVNRYLIDKKDFLFEENYNTPFLKYQPGIIFISRTKDEFFKYEIIGAIKSKSGYYRYLGILKSNTAYIITSRDQNQLDKQYKLSLNHMLKEL